MDGTAYKIEINARLAEALQVSDEEYRFGLFLDFVTSLSDDDGRSGTGAGPQGPEEAR